MSINLDLRPLSAETIKEMGYKENELWLIKIGAVVFGPFETQSLKHYLKENADLFKYAEASLMSEKKWRPFWTHATFERRKSRAQGESKNIDWNGPFWIMERGLRTGPLTSEEIDRKIEKGLLMVTDYISIDQGVSWIKVFQIKKFDRRTLSSDELPVRPHEGQFLKGAEEIANTHQSFQLDAISELADLTWQGMKEDKSGIYHLYDLNWKGQRFPLAAFFRWIIPGMGLVALGFVTTSFFLLSSFDPLEESVEEEQITTNSTSSGAIRSMPNPPPSVGVKPKGDFSQFNHLKPFPDQPDEPSKLPKAFPQRARSSGTYSSRSYSSTNSFPMPYHGGGNLDKKSYGFSGVEPPMGMRKIVVGQKKYLGPRDSLTPRPGYSTQVISHQNADDELPLDEGSSSEAVEDVGNDMVAREEQPPLEQGKRMPSNSSDTYEDQMVEETSHY